MILFFWLILYSLFLFYIFYPKHIDKIWLLLLGVFPLVVIYIMNPNNRIYGYHGFWHAGIVYQILNGGIPPSNPLLAGYPLFCHWGYHFLVACITRIFNITPFYSSACLKIVSLSLALILVYKISSSLIKNEKANVFSAAISIFGISIMNPLLLRLLSESFHVSVEKRAFPIFQKFSNACGTPIGLVFFLLFLFSVIKLFEGKRKGLYLILFLISVLGCGFFYSPMLFGIVAVTLAVSLAMVAFNRRDGIAFNLQRIIPMIVLLSTCILVLWPYLSLVSLGVAKQTQFFEVGFVFNNLIKYTGAALPILIIIYINKNSLKSRLNRKALVILIVVIVTNFCIYIFSHAPWTAEYKFLILSTVSLGIIGGIAFNAMAKWRNRFVVSFLLFLFLYPSYCHLRLKLLKLKGIANMCVEKESYVHHKDEEENQLYQWIKKNTPPDAIFIDSALTIPIFTQRRLFIGLGVDLKKGKRLKLGYTNPIEYFLLTYGYDPDLVKRRRRIVRSIYNLDQRLSDREMENFFESNKDIYIVVREESLRDKFDKEKFNKVFESFKGNFVVYKPKPG